MKIIFALPDLGSGGAERVVSLLSNELIDKGYSVDIIMMFGNRIQYQLHPQINLIQLDLGGLSKFDRILKLRRQLKILINDNNEVIIVQFQDSVLNTMLIASFGLKTKIIACERNNPYIKGTSLMKKLRAMLPYKFADYCVFQTPDARKYYSIVSDKSCSVIINPITIPQLSWNGKIDEKHLISICRLHKQKNIPMTLEVIDLLKNKYPNIHLDIYGEGNMKDEILEEIRKRGLQNNITLCGTTKQVTQKLAEASIFISTSDFEGISNSMLEAMAVGLPMVCTDCPIGGARLMLGDGAGLLSEIGNIKQFAENLDGLLHNHDKCRLMSAFAKEKASQYTLLNIAQRWIDVFNKLKK